MQARQVLHKLLQKVCSEMHKLRRTALFVNVMAALHGEVLTVTPLGRSIRSEAKEKHCIKRADRLLSNHRLQGERLGIYSSLTPQLIGHKQRPVIILEWSDLDECKRHFLLRASVPVEGRSLTLYEEGHTLRSKEKPKTHRRFLQTLQKRLSPHCRPILVTEAGVRTSWFKQVEELGWDWVGRIRNRHEGQLPGEAQWVPCKSLYPRATSIPKALGRAGVTQSNPITCQLVLYKAKPKGRVHLNRLGQASQSAHSRKHTKAQREPWLLGTSLPEGFKLAQKVVKLYALRMRIEESFRDLKSTRFGLSLELHPTYQLEPLQGLLLIATLALRVAWLMGKATELTGQARHYQANTVKTRVVLSTLFLGLKVIDDSRVTLRLVDVIAATNSLHENLQQHCYDGSN
ncbi:MAG TPA: IS4 family transposase [Gammaproteobacteria bacterium]|nr:IS4 family transposase [Gammaproteobacteria bacterium]